MGPAEEGITMSVLERYLILCQDLIYWAARDMSMPTGYNRKCLANTIRLKDELYEQLTMEQKARLFRGKGRFPTYKQDVEHGS